MNEAKVVEPVEIRHNLTVEQNQFYAIMKDKALKAAADLVLAQQVLELKKEAFNNINEASNLFLTYVIKSANLPKTKDGYSPQQYAAGQFAVIGIPIPELPSDPSTNSDTNKK